VLPPSADMKCGRN